MTKGSHDSREMVDMRSKVSVKRLFRKAVFCRCEEHNEPHRLSNQKNFVYQAEIGD